MTFHPRQPGNNAEKAQVAASAMGMKLPKAHKTPGKFHRMSIDAAENGVTVEHFTHSEKEHGGANTPSFPETKSTKHVIQHGHKMHSHIQALNDYFTDPSGTQPDGDSDND